MAEFKVDFTKHNKRTGTKGSSKAPSSSVKKMKTTKPAQTKVSKTKSTKAATPVGKTKKPRKKLTEAEKAAKKKEAARKKAARTRLKNARALDREIKKYMKEMKADFKQAREEVKAMKKAELEAEKKRRAEERARKAKERADKEAARIQKRDAERAKRDFERIARNKAKAEFKSELAKSGQEVTEVTDDDIRDQMKQTIAEKLNKYYYTDRSQSDEESEKYGFAQQKDYVQSLVKFDISGLDEKAANQRVKMFRDELEKMDTSELSKVYVEINDIAKDTEYKNSGYQRKTLEMIKARILNSTDVSNDMKQLIKMGGYQSVIDYLNYRALQKMTTTNFEAYKYEDNAADFWNNSNPLAGWREMQGSTLVSGMDKDAENFVKYQLSLMRAGSMEALQEKVNYYLGNVSKKTSLNVEKYRI